MIWLEEHFSRQLHHPWHSVDDAFRITGEIYREPAGTNRRTLRFELAGEGYFLKLHWGVGWKEILKNLVSLRLPVLGASNEWRAIRRLHELGVETMNLAAYGQTGRNPATLRSFVVTRELKDTVSLEDYCADWAEHPPAFAAKHKLIQRVAEITRKLHQHGVNHRDLYICHFLLQQPWHGDENNLQLYLIDLHRVQIRQRTPLRWRVKDVGALYFSAMDAGLNQRDLLRFIRVYSQQPLRQVLAEEGRFWQAVTRRAQALYEE
jgi:heptose I phosphotransferase